MPLILVWDSFYKTFWFCVAAAAVKTDDTTNSKPSKIENFFFVMFPS